MYIPWHCRLSRGNCNGTQRLFRGFIIIIVIAIIGINVDVIGNTTITVNINRICSIIIIIIISVSSGLFGDRRLYCAICSAKLHSTCKINEAFSP